MACHNLPFTGDQDDIEALLSKLRVINSLRENERIDTNNGRIVRNTWGYLQGVHRRLQGEDHRANLAEIARCLEQTIRVVKTLYEQFQSLCRSQTDSDDREQRLESAFTIGRLLEQFLYELDQLPESITRWSLQYRNVNDDLPSRVESLCGRILTQTMLFHPQVQQTRGQLEAEFCVPLTSAGLKAMQRARSFQHTREELGWAIHQAGVNTPENSPSEHENKF